MLTKYSNDNSKRFDESLIGVSLQIKEPFSWSFVSIPFEVESFEDLEFAEVVSRQHLIRLIKKEYTS